MTNPKPIRTFFYWLSSIVLLGSFALTMFGYAPIKNRLLLKSQLVSYAKSQTDLHEVSRIDVYHGKATSYAIFGHNKAQSPIIVILPEQAAKPEVYQANDGISALKARAIAQKAGAKAIQTIRLGMEDHQILWEVKARGAFYLIDFQTGELVRKEVL
ncbi:DUF5590 domain-containing protein [Streptococcus halichoeri]|uniref:cell wall elongation regulator TseB-like domain-containing protein n=1 Tax=Streptococcus halichoeri TaxID=254785 RepID=UPI0013573160|nr:DUF5590 domain-containing protein [Streptococcus halichoeri]